MDQSKVIESVHHAIKGKKHVIWDWNGTLLDDVSHAVSVVNSLLVEQNLPQLDIQTYREVFDFPVVNYYQKLGFDFDKEPFELLCNKFVERFMVGVPTLPLKDVTKSVLMQLHSQKINQSVLSATDQVSLDNMMIHFKLESVFKFVFGIEDKLAGSKLHRGHELIKMSGISESQTVIIGDTLHDLEVAQALGIDAVLISHGHQCVKRLRPHCQALIEA